MHKLVLGLKYAETHQITAVIYQGAQLPALLVDAALKTGHLSAERSLKVTLTVCTFCIIKRHLSVYESAVYIDDTFLVCRNPGGIGQRVTIIQQAVCQVHLCLVKRQTGLLQLTAGLLLVKRCQHLALLNLLSVTHVYLCYLALRLKLYGNLALGLQLAVAHQLLVKHLSLQWHHRDHILLGTVTAAGHLRSILTGITLFLTLAAANKGCNNQNTYNPICFHNHVILQFCQTQHLYQSRSHNHREWSYVCQSSSSRNLPHCSRNCSEHCHVSA